MKSIKNNVLFIRKKKTDLSIIKSKYCLFMKYSFKNAPLSKKILYLYLH